MSLVLISRNIGFNQFVFARFYSQSGKGAIREGLPSGICARQRRVWNGVRRQPHLRWRTGKDEEWGLRFDPPCAAIKAGRPYSAIVVNNHLLATYYAGVYVFFYVCVISGCRETCCEGEGYRMGHNCKYHRCVCFGFPLPRWAGSGGWGAAGRTCLSWPRL